MSMTSTDGRRHVGFVWAGTAMGFGALSAFARPVQPIDFVISPSSGLAGTTSLSVDNSGTLIGNWEATSNPTGTRTKPGLFGAFGPTENVPVPVTLGAQVGGNLASQTSGAFRLTLDTGLNTVQIENYASDFLASGPVMLPATVSMLFSSFRTRTPDSIYIGGIPINLPIGDVELTSMSATQIGPPGIGTLTPTGAHTFDFFVGTPVELSASVNVLGNPSVLPPTPVLLALQGQIVITGNTATLTSVVPLVFQNSAMPGTALPQFPLDLPTILPPGGTAQLLMDLILDEIGASLDAVLTTNATGTVVPAPGALALLGVGGLLAARRRRA